MNTSSPAIPLVRRAAKATLARTAAAFAVDRARLSLGVITKPQDRIELHVTYSPADGRAPLHQRRDLNAFLQSDARVADKTRDATDEMVRTVALAFRPAHPRPPSGWSVHPAVASIVAASGGEMPNPADPFTWLQRERGEIHLPDAGNIANAILVGREGVLLLDSASIVDSSGGTVAIVRMDGPKLLVTLPGAFPETLAAALSGRTADALSTVFAADPRGRKASIRSATKLPGDRPCMVVELVDCLVPLLPSIPGRERWRPRRAKGIAEPSSRNAYLHRLGHSPAIVARYYARKASFQPMHTPPAQQAGAGPVIGKPGAIAAVQASATPKQARASGAQCAPPASRRASASKDASA